MTTGEQATFGTMLRRHRLAAGLSQEALAERAGLSAAAIASLERGRRTSPRPDTLVMLAAALGLAGDSRARFISAATAAHLPPEPRATFETAPVVAPARVAAQALPAPPTVLIGREREEAAVVHLLQRPNGPGRARLLTLIGPGGVGKTRLALAVAAELRDTFAAGAVFVDLAPHGDPALVMPTIAAALGLREAGPLSVLDVLREALGDRELLLVLDNVEQVVEAAPAIAGLVAACPRLSVLVTSRIALHVRAEQQFRVMPLPVPAPGRHASLEGLGGYAAIRLFVMRAQAVLPTFALTAENADAVTAICRHLDGLPLAIELAAARVRLLPPAALLARLERRLQVLTGGARDLPKRQQTLRAAIDWSYSLLDEREQALFARLGVFAGGCTLAAAQDICLVDADDDPNGGLDLAASLIDKSLLQQPEGDEPRLLLLETLREYAREQLDTRGETARLGRAHAAYYLRLAEAARPEISGPRQDIWLQRLAREQDNFRAALRWARDGGDRELGMRLAGILWRFWFVHGDLREGQAWLEGFMDALDTAGLDVQAEILRGVSAMAMQQGDTAQVLTWGTTGLELRRRLGDRQGMADMLNTLGNALRDQGAFDEAMARYEAGLDLYREESDRVGEAVILNNMGTADRYAGETERAVRRYEDGLALRRAAGDTHGIAFTLQNLGDAVLALGETERAEALCLESLSLCRAIGATHGIARALTVLGAVARRGGDPGRAGAYYGEALAISRGIGDRRLIAGDLAGLAWVALSQGDGPCAVHLLGAASTLRDLGGVPLTPGERDTIDDDTRAARAALQTGTQAGEGVFRAQWEAGRAAPLEAVIAEALRLARHPAPAGAAWAI